MNFGKSVFSLFPGASVKTILRAKQPLQPFLEIPNGRFRQEWPDEIKLFTVSIQSE